MAPADLFRHVVEVRSIWLRQDHLGESGTVCGQDLLLDATDGEHPTLERHFARHANHRANRFVSQQTHEGGGHRDAR